MPRIYKPVGAKANKAKAPVTENKKQDPKTSQNGKEDKKNGGEQ